MKTIKAFLKNIARLVLGTSVIVGVVAVFFYVVLQIVTLFKYFMTSMDFRFQGMVDEVIVTAIALFFTIQILRAGYFFGKNLIK